MAATYKNQQSLEAKVQVKRRNYTSNELDLLRDGIEIGVSLLELQTRLSRPAYGIVKKLRMLASSDSNWKRDWFVKYRREFNNLNRENYLQNRREYYETHKEEGLDYKQKWRAQRRKQGLRVT